MSKLLDKNPGFCNGKNIFKTLADRTLSKLGNTTILYEVILCLSRTQTYIRLRELKRKISFENCKRKLNQKISKFSNTSIKL